MGNAGDNDSNVAPLDPASFPALYEAQFSYVWKSLRRLGVPERDAPDLAHEVFLMAFKQREDFDASRPLRPWLFGIALRVSANDRRRAHRTREIGDVGGEPADEAPSPEDRAVHRERQGTVLKALEGLNADQRAVFVMHEIDGHSMPEIAEVLSAPLNTLYSRLRLARSSFSARIRELSNGEAP